MDSPIELAFFLLAALPGALMATVGWWLSRTTANPWARATIRAGLVSITLALASFGRAGILPAIWVVIFRPMGGIDGTALTSLATGWLIAFAFLALLQWVRPSKHS